MTLQIGVSLYHRDHYSQGRNRQIFGYEAYHWALLITPDEGQSEHDCDAYDATDTNIWDPVTFRMTNPTMDWHFRAKRGFDPEEEIKLIGQVVIGVLPTDVSRDELEDFFRGIPLPEKNRDPQQSCVTWLTNAIRALQKKEWIRSFDVDRFKDWALRCADEKHGSKNSSRMKVETYLP